MRKFDALMTQASTAGLGLCLYKTYSIKKCFLRAQKECKSRAKCIHCVPRLANVEKVEFDSYDSFKTKSNFQKYRVLIHYFLMFCC